MAGNSVGSRDMGGASTRDLSGGTRDLGGNNAGTRDLGRRIHGDLGGASSRDIGGSAVVTRSRRVANRSSVVHRGAFGGSSGVEHARIQQSRRHVARRR